MKTKHQKKILRNGHLNRKSFGPNIIIFRGLLLMVTALLIAFQSKAKINPDDRWQYSLSGGIHSFYAPIAQVKPERPGFTGGIGLNRLIGEKEHFALSLQFQYGRNNLQGDAGSLQVMAQFLPVLFQKIELGLGSGIGYRISLYPSEPFRWKNNDWQKGRAGKGMLQVPVQCSLGVHAVDSKSFRLIPFLAWQLQALFGYNPDYTPLPDSSILFGFKFQIKHS